MAKEPRANKTIDELKMEIARSRERVGRDFRGLRYELDFPGKIRRSLRNHTAAWITAAAVVGTLIVVLPLRKKKVYVDLKNGSQEKSKSKLLEAGFVLGALRIAATLLKPVITSFVTKKIGGYRTEPRPPKKW
jgi:hypothetical protein